MYLSDELLDRLIAEDVPYFDLTTHLMGIGDEMGAMRYFTREEAVLCGTEEAARILQKLGLTVLSARPSGTLLKPGEVFLEVEGHARSLHTGWRVCQNLVDSCSGIATRTRKMVDLVHAVNPHVAVASTRKSFPGAKALSTKAVLCGGAMPHRLGLSETVLVFRQHMAFMGGFEGFLETIPSFRSRLCEKKLIVEVDSIEEGITLCRAGVDGLQFDKMPPETLAEGIPYLRDAAPTVTVFAAGGIHEGNAARYAATGADVLVTTSLFSAKPIDVGVRMGPL